MIRPIYIPAIAIVFATGLLSTSALAGHCPKDVKIIKGAMSTLSDEKMSMAKEAADKGQKLHEAGRHGESLEVLHETMKALGIKH